MSQRPYDPRVPMAEQPPSETPPPSPEPAEAPPPPSPPAGEERKRAGAGARAGAVALALVFAFAAAVMIAVMVDIAGTPLCSDPQAIAQERQETGDLVIECFDGSQAAKTASLILGWPSGVLGALTALLALAFAIRGRGGRALAIAATAAVVLGGASILVGSI